jgi:TrmH family RNA methyltransferase
MSHNRLLLALQKKKERRSRGLFIIEGEKFVKDAGDMVEFVFTRRDTSIFDEVVSTDSPQNVAAVARIPTFTLDDLKKKSTIIVLDGVQDPGNVGTVLRAALAFHAGVILIESADPTSPKVARASVGAVLRTPWVEIPREDTEETLQAMRRKIYRLELRKDAIGPAQLPREPVLLIVGNEGQGIRLDIQAPSVAIAHSDKLESLNLGLAVGIILYERSK